MSEQEQNNTVEIVNGESVTVTASPQEAQPTQEQPQSAPATDGININVEDFMNKTSSTLEKRQENEKKRRETAELLANAINSLNKFVPIKKQNVVTNEIIAEYIQYTQDAHGKTVFDYMEDPTVQQHIHFKLPEGAKKEDKKFKYAITPEWIDTEF